MTARVSLFASLLALGLSAWTAWSVSALRTELTVLSLRQPGLERRVGRDLPGQPASPASPALPLDAIGSRAALPDTPPGSLDLDDPDVQTKIASIVEAERQRRDQERESRSRAAVRDEVTSFANEVGLAPAVTEKVVAEVERRVEAFQATRDDVREGAITWIEARREFDEQRASSDAALTALIGEELAGQLRDRVLPGPGPGGPPPGGPGGPPR